MKRFIYIFGLLLTVSAVLASCKAKSQQQSVPAWEGTLPDFIMHDRQARMGILDFPCSIEDAIKAGVYPEDTDFTVAMNTDDPIYRLAPKQIYLTDLDEYAWLACAGSEGKIPQAVLIFAKDTEEEMNDLFERTSELLFQCFGTADASGSFGIQFDSNASFHKIGELSDQLTWTLYETEEEADRVASYQIYGYMLGDKGQMGEAGWKGLIPKTGSKYCFMFSMGYYGDHKRTGVD